MDRKWAVIGKAFGMWLVSLPVELIGFVLVPILLAFCKFEDENLPRWAFWWDEPEYGINGDPYWRGADHANGHEREYWWRLRWLFRNKIGGWSYYVMGFNSANIRSLEFEGDPDTQNRPAGHSGECYVQVTLVDGTMHECYYKVAQWGNTGRCWRLYAGHKLMDILHKHVSGQPLEDGQITAVFAPNPLMGFSKGD
jgi:hypothetical protein